MHVSSNIIFPSTYCIPKSPTRENSKGGVSAVLHALIFDRSAQEFLFFQEKFAQLLFIDPASNRDVFRRTSLLFYCVSGILHKLKTKYLFKIALLRFEVQQVYIKKKFKKIK